MAQAPPATKHILVSKTFWIGFVVPELIALLSTANQIPGLVPPSVAPLIGAQGLITLMLRLVTTQGVHIS